MIKYLFSAIVTLASFSVLYATDAPTMEVQAAKIVLSKVLEAKEDTLELPPELTDTITVGGIEKAKNILRSQVAWDN